LSLSPDDLKLLLSVEPEAWKKEIEDATSYFNKFGDKLPAKLRLQLADLDQRLSAMQMAA
jgi:phosphoenolpyruvate carboxykinase (GTP)